MTKSEMEYMDSSLLGPFLMFGNQCVGTLIPERYLLYFSLVSLKKLLASLLAGNIQVT